MKISRERFSRERKMILPTSGPASESQVRNGKGNSDSVNPSRSMEKFNQCRVFDTLYQVISTPKNAKSTGLVEGK